MIEYIGRSDIYASPAAQQPVLHARFPGVVKLPSGELLAMYVLVEKIDDTIAHMYVSRLADMGKMWRFQGEMYNTKDVSADCEFNESLKPLVLKSGMLAAVGYRFNRPDLNAPIVNSQTGGFLWGPNVVSFSEDDGVSWTIPQPIDCGVPETLEIAGSPIETRSGDILAVGAVFKMWNGDNPTGQVGVLIRSGDDGKSWKSSIYYRDDVNGTTPYEARICEMQDGRLVVLVWAFSHKGNTSYPNHVVVSHDNGRTWSSPINTGIAAQSSGLMWLGGQQLLSVHCHRTGNDPGLYLYLVDFTNDQWKVVEKKLLWHPKKSQSHDGTIADHVNNLQFGQAQLLRLSENEVLVYHWGKENGLAKIIAHRIRLTF